MRSSEQQLGLGYTVLWGGRRGAVDTGVSYQVVFTAIVLLHRL